jgi:hypothetical protein
MINPNVGCDENNKPRPYVVRCIQTGVMGGYDTLAAAQSAQAMWQNQPRPKAKFDFVVERVQTAK